MRNCVSVIRLRGEKVGLYRLMVGTRSRDNFNLVCAILSDQVCVKSRVQHTLCCNNGRLVVKSEITMAG